SIYTEAKSLFQRGSKLNLSADDCILPSREIEANGLKEFIESNIINLTSNSLYISGPPGTGKTAQVNSILQSYMKNKDEDTCIKDLKLYDKIRKTFIQRRVAFVNINCMIINNPENIYDEILKKILNKNYCYKNEKYNSKDLSIFLKDDKIADISIVILDELDNLITKNQTILFDLFSYAKNKNTKLILIGISNALDLTDRFLPRLKTNNVNPKILQFLPYNSEQIKQIIIFKLQSLFLQLPKNDDLLKAEIPLIHPAAIQLCSKKVAVNTGDLRKAFDICHKSLEMVEDMTRSKLSKQDFEKLTIFEAPKVSIAIIAKVCSSLFGNNNSGNCNDILLINKLKILNLQQKTTLCSLIRFEEEQFQIKDRSINEFYQYYKTKVSLDKLIGHLKKTEFIEVISSLESFGFVNIIGGTSNNKKKFDNNNKKIYPNINKNQLAKAVEDVIYLNKIL
ncbi:hypothetical protein PACTADRAFT_28296, partial [Pachysolen tannophilus NRRL Y-2460]